MTKVFVANIALLDDDLSVYYDKISEYRQKKSEKLKNIDDKKRSVLAELLLARYLDRVPCYTVDKNGKPVGEKVEFSFSHSGNYAVCAVSDNHVGADVQKVRQVNLDVAKKFSKNEYKSILNSANPTDTFFEYWVKKESALKVSGVGLRAGLDDCKLPDGYIYTMHNYMDYKICVCANEPAVFEILTEL